MNVARLLCKEFTAAGIPHFGVSLQDLNDKASWRVDFMPEATPEHQAQAAQIVADFVPVEPKEVDVLALLVQEGVISKEKADAARGKK